jgi:hypothetical protein
MTELKEASEGTELEELKKRVAELEKAAKPAEPFVSNWPGPRDYTEGMCQCPHRRCAILLMRSPKA